MKAKMNRKSPPAVWSGIHPLLVMVGVFFLGLGFVWLSSASGLAESGLQWELTKLAMQVSLVGVAGALFTFVADNYRRKLEKRRFREDYLKDVMKRMTSSYNKSKGARRIVRGKGLTPADKPTHVRLDAYDECMKIVNEAQLDLEAVMRDLKTSMLSFPEDIGVHAHVKSMESYLNKIVSEYEKVRARPEEGEKELSLLDVERFGAFIAMKAEKPEPEKIIPFDDYADDHGDARDTINDELLNLTGNKG